MKNLFRTLIAILAGIIGAAPAAAVRPTSVSHPRWSRNAVIYEVNTRQFTPEGTFDAFAESLPRLKDLGVDILWFMPVHPISALNRKGTLGSYYAVADYKAVNPEFGDLDAFRRVVDKAHALGMKVIIDWVPNHTGCDNPWVAEHPDWYARDDKGRMYGPYDWTDVYQLDYSNPQLRRAMIDAMRFWIDNAGIDGFRCDVAGRVPVDFWNQARTELEKAKGPDGLFMLAEATEPELLDAAFDMDYNWPMKDLQNAIAATRGAYTFVRPGETAPAVFPVKNASDIALLVRAQAAEYPAGSFMMNMVTNHDLNSWEGTERQRYGRFLPAMAALTYMLPGMPLIYTGQEAGLDRPLAFFEKDSIPEFGDLTRPRTPAAATTAMYRRLNSIRHSHPQLASGNAGITFPRVDDPDNQLAILRTLPGERTALLGLFNFGDKPMDIKPFIDGASSAVIIGAGGIEPFTTSLAPGAAAIVDIPAPAAR